MEFAQGSLPGISAVRETGEWQGVYRGDNGEGLILRSQVIVGSGATDSGNSPTTTLRAGLILGRKSSDGKFYPYSATATDGTQVPEVVLPIQLSMLNPLGVAEDKLVAVFSRANLLVSSLANADEQALRALSDRGFQFDLPGGAYAFGTFRGVEVVSGATLLNVSDSGKLYVCITNAVTFTLPTIAAGLCFEMLQTSDTNMAVTGAANTVLVDGNAAATTVTYSTASHKIGSRIRVRALQFGATLKWTVENLGSTAMTIT